MPAIQAESGVGAEGTEPHQVHPGHGRSRLPDRASSRAIALRESRLPQSGGPRRGAGPRRHRWSARLVVPKVRDALEVPDVVGEERQIVLKGRSGQDDVKVRDELAAAPKERADLGEAFGD